MAKAGCGGYSHTMEEIADPNPPIQITRFILGSDLSLAGDNSFPSSMSNKSITESDTPSPQTPAQTTESRWRPDHMESSSVDSTDGNGPETEIPPYAEWLLPELRAECKTRGLPVSGNKDELVDRLTADDSTI